MSALRSFGFAVAALATPTLVSAQYVVDKDAENCLFAEVPSEVIDSCSRVITAGNPGKQGVARMYRGKSYLRLTDYRAAAEDFEVVLKTNPKLAFALYGHGVAQLHLGKVANGKAEIVRAIVNQPDISDQFAEFGIPAPAFLKGLKQAKSR